MILILSHLADSHTVEVLSKISRRGHSATLLDSSDFPIRASLNQVFSTAGVNVEYVSAGHRIDLTACRAAWWRRPPPYTLHDEIKPSAIAFAHSECHEAFTGGLALLDLTWINPPHLDAHAHHKPLQLATAIQTGLLVPRTLITNDPEAARQFITEIGPGRTIYKTFRATSEHWRETRLLREEELELLDLVRFAPVIFQKHVAAEADIRVTIVGERMFATAIRPDPNGYTVDYRVDMDSATFVPIQLPVTIQEQLRAFMNVLGLVYGAVDLLRTPDGEYIFLEVNPAGEWLFVEERTRQPITAAMADLLVRLDHAN